MGLVKSERDIGSMCKLWIRGGVTKLSGIAVFGLCVIDVVLADSRTTLSFICSYCYVAERSKSIHCSTHRTAPRSNLPRAPILILHILSPPFSPSHDYPQEYQRLSTSCLRIFSNSVVACLWGNLGRGKYCLLAASRYGVLSKKNFVRVGVRLWAA